MNPMLHLRLLAGRWVAMNPPLELLGCAPNYKPAVVQTNVGW